MNTQTTVTWQQLLIDAVKEPGKLLEAYSAFYEYSLGNQLLALSQCQAKKIPAGPIATFEGWMSKGRYVRKGEQAICLCQPTTFKKHDDVSDEDKTVVYFTFKSRWFVLAQTDGKDYDMPAIPGWDRATALAKLDIAEQPFDLASGNTQGYAQGRTIHINPLAQLPIKTTFHELAHVVLGHTTKEQVADHGEITKCLKEAEAESVAMLLCATLQLPGVEYCRGYIQNWLKDATIPESNARRIFAAADKILKAGQVAA